MRGKARTAAEAWFLERGLPSVLTRRARWRRLWPRSAPMLAAYATLQVCTLLIYLITGGRDVNITGEPTTSEWIVLAVLGLALPLMAVVGWLVSRSRSGRTRTGIATIAVVVTACVAVTVGGPTQLAQEAVVVTAVLILTGCGAGSVVGWAVRMMLSHLVTVGALVVRALPVVLLTALVFFNTYVWLMAATISGDRLGLAMAFLISIAVAFVISRHLAPSGPLPGGAEKPEPAIFQAALSALNATPETAVMVGDSLRRDGEGARRSGLSFIWVAPQDVQAAERCGSSDARVLAAVTRLPDLIDILT